MRRAVQIGAIGGGAVLAAALIATAASAQVKPGSETGLGLTGADVPQLLKDIKADPYRAATAPACDTIPAEIQAIDDLIGHDVDFKPPPSDTTTKVEDQAMKSGASVVRGLVPYGGVVRFVTGANKKDDALREAIVAGYARRGYLRGVQATLKCPAPTPAAEPKSEPKPLAQPAKPTAAR